MHLIYYVIFNIIIFEDKMNWKIEFYSDRVKQNIIKGWPKKIRTKFALITELIEEFGPEEVGMPHVSPFGGGLFEIRAKGEEGIGRAIFCNTKGKVIVILNEFIKKTQKTPPRELELAKKRMVEVKKNEQKKT